MSNNVKFKHHLKLEFDIKTNNEDLINILQGISEIVHNNLELNLKSYTEIRVLPTLTDLSGTEQPHE